jgi:hypothetical protein
MQANQSAHYRYAHGHLKDRDHTLTDGTHSCTAASSVTAYLRELGMAVRTGTDTPPDTVD